MSVPEEIAKATQEVAKTTQRFADLTDKYFGGALANFGEMLEVRSAVWKLNNLISCAKRIDKMVKEHNLGGKVEQIVPRQALPLIQAMSEEDDPDLQGLWASYVANGLTGGGQLTRRLTNILRDLEPADVGILRRIFDLDIGLPRGVRLTVDMIAFEREAGCTHQQAQSFFSRATAAGLFSHEADLEMYLIGEGARGFEAPLAVSFPTEVGTFTPTPLLLMLQNATAAKLGTSAPVDG